MSEGFAMIPREVLWSDLDVKAKLVYLGLSARADRQQRCYPSHAKLAADLGIGVSSVREGLAILRDEGLVSWTEQRRQDGGKSSNVYTLGVTPSSPGNDGASSAGDGPLVAGRRGASSPGNEQEERESGGTRAMEGPSSAGADVARLPGRVQVSQGFDSFWQLYPRKVAKQAAVKAFASAVKRAPIAVILEGVTRFAHDPNLPPKAEERFIPHPSKWLNDGRWEDGPLPPRRGGGSRQSDDDVLGLLEGLRGQEGGDERRQIGGKA